MLFLIYLDVSTYIYSWPHSRAILWSPMSFLSSSACYASQKKLFGTVLEERRTSHLTVSLLFGFGLVVCVLDLCFLFFLYFYYPEFSFFFNILVNETKILALPIKFLYSTASRPKFNVGHLLFRFGSLCFYKHNSEYIQISSISPSST